MLISSIINESDDFFLLYSLIMTLKYGIVSQSTAVFLLSVSRKCGDHPVMHEKINTSYNRYETGIILKNTVIHIFGHTAQHYSVVF